MKARNGITMVSLVITVIILMILSAIGISFGVDSIKSSKDNKLASELLMVQHAILEQYTKYQAVKDSSILIGNKVQLSEVQSVAEELGITLASIPNSYNNKDYYKLDKASLLEIGIKNTNDEYIVNYVSGEVINITKKTTSDNNVLYVRGNSFYK